ncbi:DUF1045 domain-containing protein [Methylopila musalis]|uniref:DUF1045 domain-containing protein n=1 Tax=Methylopila musalis TaxID=1134781 RepID=A0ABW3Z559_9HYPH
MTARYAIYYAPAPESPLWSFGSGVLGYDAASGVSAPVIAPDGIAPAEWAVMTAAPRRYGFHATLKAPFHLRDGVTEDDLVAAGRAFAATRAAFALPELELTRLGAFVALQPKERSSGLDDLASACVEAFEPFRAAPDADERARRLETPLTERQQSSLARWGYPYVFEDFHFHMTLAGPVADGVAPLVTKGLTRLYADHVAFATIRVEAVSLFVEDAPGRGFRIVDRFVFAG